MLGINTEKNRGTGNILWLVGATLVLLFFSSVVMTPASTWAITSVNATICGAGSQITITEPLSDSVVTSPMITLKGTVAQATQIEVTVDGSFDSVIPLTSGQLAYEAPMQLSAGTHTVKLTAIDSCQSSDASATTIVTFTPPPSTASTGNQAATGVANDTTPGGVTISSDPGTLSETHSFGEGLIPRPVSEAFNGLLMWLNIAPADSSSESAPKLSIIRAVTIAVGMYMATIGVATTVVSFAASTPLFQNVKPARRFATANRSLRIVGIVLIFGGFFL